MSRQIASFRWSTGLVTLALAGCLSACGGGGGGSDVNAATPSALPPPPVAHQAVQLDSPTFMPAGTLTGPANWDYGDGTQGTSASHTFSAPGTYAVTYSYTDSKGLAAKGSIKVDVQACSNAGIAAAKASPSTTNVCVQTSKGEMVFALDANLAPLSTANFMAYVKKGYYNSTVVHRVEQVASVYWVIQGGLVGLDDDGYFYKTPDGDIALESRNGLRNKRYTLGMARGPAVDSANSQFYINLMDAPAFDYQPGVRDGYAVFGSIISGTDVADAMGAVPTKALSVYPKFPSTPLVYIGMTPI
jgi:peptidyl-prolyl cis-trans isomerase A (cyclophilin A)